MMAIGIVPAPTEENVTGGIAAAATALTELAALTFTPKMLGSFLCIDAKIHGQSFRILNNIHQPAVPNISAHIRLRG